MKGPLVFGMVAALVVLVASAGMATTAGAIVETVGDLTTYTYTITSSELNDLITSFHVYAPLHPSLVVGWEAENDWLFAVDADLEIDGADIYWWAPDPVEDGLPYGQTVQVSMTVPSTTSTDYNFIVPGFLGNWGYETYNFAGWGVLVSFPPVPVPVGQASLPEPASLAALAFGCAVLAARRRR